MIRALLFALLLAILALLLRAWPFLWEIAVLALIGGVWLLWFRDPPPAP